MTLSLSERFKKIIIHAFYLINLRLVILFIECGTKAQNGIAMSESHDGIQWNFVGNTNLKGTHPCVIFNKRAFGIIALNI